MNWAEWALPSMHEVARQADGTTLRIGIAGQTDDRQQVGIPREWVFLRYYAAYNMLFRVENSLRMFVYLVLKRQHRDKWASMLIYEGEGSKITIKEYSDQRSAQAKRLGYLNQPVTCPLLFLGTGELVRLITSESNWKYFRRHFQADRPALEHKFREIVEIRNAVAHFRAIAKENLDDLKRNIDQLFPGIEDLLQNALIQELPVSDGGDTTWWNDAIECQTTGVPPEVCASKDGKWIRVTLRHKCRALDCDETTNGMQYQVVNIRSSIIVEKYPLIRKHLAYACESVESTEPDSEKMMVFGKLINLVFPREALDKDWDEIHQSLKQVADSISAETEALVHDQNAPTRFANIATARYIEFEADAKHVLQQLRRKIKTGSVKKIVFCIPDASSLYSDTHEGCPAEYWGNENIRSETWVSQNRPITVALTHYPWMTMPVAPASLKRSGGAIGTASHNEDNW